MCSPATSLGNLTSASIEVHNGFVSGGSLELIEELLVFGSNFTVDHSKYKLVELVGCKDAIWSFHKPCCCQVLVELKVPSTISVHLMEHRSAILSRFLIHLQLEVDAPRG